MEPVTTSAIIGAGTSLATAVGGLSKLASKRWRRDQDWLMGKQYDHWQRMFDYEANYNSPLAQKNRMRDAGLNPNLMYGNGASSTGNVAMSPSSSGTAPNVGSLAPDRAIGSIGDTAMQIANLQLIKAQTRKINAEAEGQESVNPELHTEIQARISRLRAETQVLLNENDFYKLSSDIQYRLLISKNNLLIANAAQVNYVTNNLLPAQKTLTEANVLHVRRLAAIAQAELNMMPARAENLAASTCMLMAAAYKSYQEGRFTPQVMRALAGYYGGAEYNQRQMGNYYRDYWLHVDSNLDKTLDTTERGQNLNNGFYMLGGIGLGALVKWAKSRANKPIKIKGFRPGIFPVDPTSDVEALFNYWFNDVPFSDSYFDQRINVDNILDNRYVNPETIPHPGSM